jgi:xylulokinase
MASFLGVDIGTTSVKAGLFDERGRCLGKAEHDYLLHMPAVDRVELDAETYWTATVSVVRRALAQSPTGARDVQALTISSQGETTIAVDAAGRPLHPALVWLDKRARSQADRLRAALGPQVYVRTGIPEVNPTWSACKIAWLVEHHPDITAAAHMFLLPGSFIVHRLTGAFVADGALICTTLLYDIVRHTWWDQAVRLAGINLAQLPEIRPMGSVAGRLNDAAALALGMPAGLPVVLGGMDQVAGAVGSGNVTDEIVSESTGGALTIQVSLGRPDLDPHGRVPVYEHALPGKYLFDPVCDTGGMALKWFRDTFAADEVAQAGRTGGSAYDRLTQAAARVAAGSDGLIMLPHLTGAFSPEYNSLARGVFYGFTLAHRREHFARAVLEAVAYMLRRNLESLSAVGLEVREVRATGGGARSGLWRQIKADVCNLPVVSLRESDTALLGDAILAAVAVGRHDSLGAACAAMVEVGERLRPDPAAQALYEKAYRRYGELYAALDPLFRTHFADGGALAR